MSIPSKAAEEEQVLQKVFLEADSNHSRAKRRRDSYTTGTDERETTSKRTRIRSSSPSSTASSSNLKRKLDNSSTMETDQSLDQESMEEHNSKRLRVEPEQSQLPSSSTNIADQDIINDVLKTTPLVHLPLEILGEILTQTADPDDLLAVARSCKTLCAQLLSPDASYIWRQLRNDLNLPKPEAYKSTYNDPETGKEITINGVRPFIGREAAYAAFIFDGGVCKTCDKRTDRMYHSFALRIRYCGDAACVQDIDTGTVEGQLDLSWDTAPRRVRINLLASREANVRQRLALAGETAYYSIWNEFCTALEAWKRKWDEKMRSLRNQNEEGGRNFAFREHWEWSDLKANTTFAKLLEFNTRKLRKVISLKDFIEIRPQLARELFILNEKREKAAKAKIIQDNPKRIWKFYKIIESNTKDDYPFIPPFSTFRTLPAIKIVESPDFNPKVDAQVAFKSSSFLRPLLKSQIDDWVEKAKLELSKTLPNVGDEWARMVPCKTMIHPVLGPEARWKCKNCDHLERRYQMDECMDFRGVCKHECLMAKGKLNKKGKGGIWNANNFVRDEQASAAILQALKILGVSSENPDEYTPEYNRSYWKCMSCDPPIGLHHSSIIGHSHRHPVPMKLEKVTKIQANSWRPALNKRGTTRFIRDDIKKRTWEEQLVFGCIYCHHIKEREKEAIKEREGKEEERKEDEGAAGSSAMQVISIMEDNSAMCVDEDIITEGACTTMEKEKEEGKGKEKEEGKEKGKKEKEKKPENKFTFNGLRSHLSSKHKIYRVGDEDYFCYTVIDFNEDKFSSGLGKYDSLLFDLLDLLRSS